MTRRRAAIAITPALLRRWPLPALDDQLGKVARGTVLVVGGSEQIPGAAMLAALASLRAGAGTLVIATSRNIAPHVAVAVPEARVIGVRATVTGELAPTSARELRDELTASDAILVGPGMRDRRAARGVITSCVKLNARAPVVIDAGALAAFRELRSRPASAVLTPHAGEMASLLDLEPEDVLAKPQDLALEAARELGAIVVLKGAVTYVAAPDGACYANTAGNLGLGTCGSGDTLSGVIAGLAARGATILQAAVWGVHVHAKAGEVLARDIGPLGYLARELLAEIPGLVGSYAKRRHR
ncbi:MAG: NAD(P)H-hydrate dehydratase [Deltaproteobacteria bacterium]|nr:NAD(P)H-hydrate dehydratase [Deltaproteobacteria bacterium]